MTANRKDAPPPPPLVVPTKLGPPRLRPDLIARPVLLERLREGRSCKLTLVCAPAGYGKSTLLAQWLAADRRRTKFSWVSLDELDDDPIRLWTHIVVGLHQGNGRLGGESLAALAAGPRAIAERVLPLLIEELEDAQPRVLVLEDWHVVRNPVCDQTMSFFVDHSPETLQIVVSSRSDPGLHVPRLRAHGELVEVRMRDLRASPDEATALFSAAQVDLRRRDVLRLTRRTEGWLAGLWLALLAVKAQPDRRRFVAEFSGDNRHVFDYLSRDVLDTVPQERRDFLVRTSVLHRLSGPLCNAVLERSDSAAILAELEQADMFLVSLGDREEQYRYHHLFAAMLRRELEATDPGSVPGLHARASLWYEEHGDIEQAVDHVIASGDVGRASTLVTRAAVSLVSTGRTVTLQRWLDALSWPDARNDRQLAIMRAFAAPLSGQGREEVERWLAVAEDGPDFGPLANGITSVRSGVAMIRSTYMSRGIGDAERSASLVLESEPAGSEWRYAGLVPLGQALFLAGREEEARAPLQEARTLPGARRRLTTAHALAYLAHIALAEGDAERGERLARDGLALAEEIGHATSIGAAVPNLALGCALMHGPDLRGAIEHLGRAVELAGGDLNLPSYWRAHALLHLAAALHQIRDDGGAREALARARADLDELPDPGILEALYQEGSDNLLSHPRREGYLGEDLSPAELRILRALARGGSLNDAARSLWLSQHTVKTHRRSIYRKLGATTRDEMVARATDLRLLDGEPEDERDESAS